MIQTIDLANHEGPLHCYVAFSENNVRGTVTLLFKLGPADALNRPCLKLRLTAEQFRAFQQAVATAPEFPGADLQVVLDEMASI